MENKLVFEPTTLTQYNWRKYKLLSQYTYYWRVYSAIAEYLYVYNWQKYEAIRNNGYLWDRYSIDYETRNMYLIGLYKYQEVLDTLQYTPNGSQRYGAMNYNQQGADLFGYITIRDYYNIFGKYPDIYYIKDDYYIAQSYIVDIYHIRGSGSSRYGQQWIFSIYMKDYPETVANYMNAAQTMMYNGHEIYFYIRSASSVNRIVNRNQKAYLEIERDSRWNGFDNVIEYEGQPYYAYVQNDFSPIGTITIPIKGDFIDEVISSNQNAYPVDGEQNGYWYDYYGSISTHYKYIYTKPVEYTVYQGYLVAFYPANTYTDEYNNPQNVLATYQFIERTDGGMRIYIPGHTQFENAIINYDYWFDKLKAEEVIPADASRYESAFRDYGHTPWMGFRYGMNYSYQYNGFEEGVIGSSIAHIQYIWDNNYREWKTKTIYDSPNQQLDRYLVFDIDGITATKEFKLRFAIPNNINVRTLPFKPAKYLDTRISTTDSHGTYISGHDLTNALFYDGSCVYEGFEFLEFLNSSGGVDVSKTLTNSKFNGYGPNYLVSREDYDLDNYPMWWEGAIYKAGVTPILRHSAPYYFGLYPTNETYSNPNNVVTIISYKGIDDEALINAGYTFQSIEEDESDLILNPLSIVSSELYNAYPMDGLHTDGYYYIFNNTEEYITGYHRGEYIEEINNDSITAYPEDGVFNGLWYQYYQTAPVYSQGAFMTTVASFIETAYPNNGYVINDAWYEYTGSQQITVNQLEINKSQLMGGVNYTQEINPSEDLMIGAGGAAQVDFTIYAPDANAATQYLGKDFIYYVKMPHDSDWRQVGVFTLTKAELPDKQTAKIEGFDYIYKFDTVIDGWLDSLTFPMTLGNLFNSLCQYVGCEAYSTEFNNSNFVVNDNFEAVQITGRTILQYIAEVSGGFCVAEPDGRIHIKQYSIPPTGNINLGNDSYVKYTHEIYNVPVITSVVVRKDDEDEGVESNV